MLFFYVACQTMVITAMFTVPKSVLYYAVYLYGPVSTDISNDFLFNKE